MIILGPDGCGKTTVSDELAAALSNENCVRRLNFSFGILPPLSQLIGRKKRIGAPEGLEGSGMVEPLNLYRASTLAVWYGLDHLLGHWKIWRMKSGETMIFARAYHDFLYQRAYLKVPKWIPMMFLALGPKPDLLGVPVRDPRTVHEQKPELTVQEISEQYSRIDSALKNFTYYVAIDASGGIETTVDELRRLLKAI